LLFILASLAEGPKHGYRVMKDVTTLSGNMVPAAKIYGSLATLRQEGLIEALPADGRRYPYRLTPDGAHVLRRQLEDLRFFVLTTLDRLPP
jgi:DNA-binding PadR family transcriptional regulator